MMLSLIFKEGDYTCPEQRRKAQPERIEEISAFLVT
jgi:hypothetical protein